MKISLETRQSHQYWRAAVEYNGRAYLTAYHTTERRAAMEALDWLQAQGHKTPTDEAWRALEAAMGALA